MKEFCEIYNLTSLIQEPTCFKSPLNPTSIDLMLTNRPRQFQNSHTVETGLSDHHKITITVLKTFFQKQSPTIIKYRDYKMFNVNLFRDQLLSHLTHGCFNSIIFANLVYACVNSKITSSLLFLKS